jgi:hypothetical protein
MANPFGTLGGTGYGNPTSIYAQGASTSRFHGEWTDQIFENTLEAFTWSKRLGMFTWEKATAIKQEWDERTPYELTATTHASTGSLADGTTGTLTLASGHGARFTTEMLVRVPRTGEQIIIDAVDDSADTVNVLAREVGNTAGTYAINAGEELQLLGPARQERSSAIEGTGRTASFNYNLIQLITFTLDMSKNARNTKQRFGNFDAWKSEMAQLEARLLRSMTLAFFNQGRALDTTADSANPRTVMGGARSFLTSTDVNVDNGGGVLTFSDIKDWVSAWKAKTGATQADFVMRPEIYAEFTSMFTNDIHFNDTLPKTLNLHLQALNYCGVKINLHAEQVLADGNDNTIYAFNTSRIGKYGDLIRIKHMPWGGGTENTGGKPNWIFDQQPTNSYTADVAQIGCNWCPLFIGGGNNQHFKVDNVGW